MNFKEEAMKNLNKVKFTTIIFSVLAVFFLLSLFIIDSNSAKGDNVVSVIGVVEEKVYKDAQFSLDFVAYGLSKEEAEKKVDDKVLEIRGLVSGFDEMVSEEVETSLKTECIINYNNYYQVQFLNNGECLTKNWRTQSRITIVVKGEKYSDDVKNKFSSLAPKIVNAVSGPEFIQKDLGEDFQESLLEKAMENAKKKAGKMALEGNKKLGDVVDIDENPLVNGKLTTIQSDEKTDLLPNEDLITKKIGVKFELVD